MDYAIDFGSSNTVIARRSPSTGQPETVVLPGLSQADGLIPTLVCAAEKSQFLCGQKVREYVQNTSPQTPIFHHFKRQLLQSPTSDYPQIKEVGAYFFQQVLRGLEQQNYPLDTLVLTTPVDAFESYRQWLTEQGRAWPFTQIRLLDEPTAAAIGYGVAASELVLVVDFGGGTLDLALVQLQRPGTQSHLGWILRSGERQFTANQKPSQAQVRAKVGLNLGGADIDRWIVDYLVQKQGLTLGDGMPLTPQIAEGLKIQLSAKPSSNELYFDPQTKINQNWFLERTELDQILREQGFFEQLDSTMNHLLEQARVQGYRPQDVDAVLLVGGTSRMPAVYQWLQGYFPATKIHPDRPLEAVAYGALGVNLTAKIEDFLYHSYGLRYWDKRRQGHHWHELIPAGHPYPSPEPLELILGASQPGQTTLELVLGELSYPTGTGAVYFHNGRLVLRPQGVTTPQAQVLNEAVLLPLEPPGQPGTDRIHLAFTVNQHRQLCLMARDLLTDQVLWQNQPILTLA
ncbi:DnaK-type molecular chaperone [Gloeomargarita lithophora Alchichica-D10]|uniref:DnaK-type molecular chaperone n=1 Tax=Gloeomargarita lithophora Alchichica-D10 TaxID=1188229 RepID=A0A1J0AE95_9CYAN|nr:Hsp70 family protein [Gloeomargarita lithophora]APB34231.1 DnaK-type molecular chaperone [Gloeomargarita lithophora Alchichica-D10]